jgi:FixJ family two-component response regulator
VRIVLSGYTELKAVTDAINEGAVYKFLTKPWDDDLLRAHIREAFQRYELRAENERLAQQLADANARLSRAKGELETEVEHSVGVLKVSQEILERLPVGTVGIESGGIVVAANRKAEEILDDGPGHPLLGAIADERLPPAMTDCVRRMLAGGVAEGGIWRSPQQRQYRFTCQLMGSSSGSQGAMLTVVPMEEC